MNGLGCSLGEFIAKSSGHPAMNDTLWNFVRLKNVDEMQTFSRFN
jgi:hypothetical protein